MQEVGFAIAMGNAAPEVRDAARLQVGHVDEGGLLEALAFALAP
jgi:hydroxymethylpyrimidine pyrophosphatase-like HAD family hydrolase